MPEQFRSIRSSLVAELTTATSQVTKTVNRLNILAARGNCPNPQDGKEIRELSIDRSSLISQCGQILQKLGAHRAEGDC